MSKIAWSQKTSRNLGKFHINDWNIGGYIMYFLYLIPCLVSKSYTYVLINFGSKVNAMSPVFAATLSLTTKITNVGTQKIDSFFLKTDDMVLAGFSLQNSLEKIQFLRKIFLLAITSMKIVLKIFFSFFNIVNLWFNTEKFTWRFYTIIEALPTTKSMELID